MNKTIYEIKLEDQFSGCTDVRKASLTNEMHSLYVRAMNTRHVIRQFSNHINFDWVIVGIKTLN